MRRKTKPSKLDLAGSPRLLPSSHIYDKSAFLRALVTIVEAIMPIEDLILIPTAALIINRDPATVRKMVERGTLAHVQIDGYVFVAKSEVLEYKPQWTRPDSRNRREKRSGLPKFPG